MFKRLDSSKKTGKMGKWFLHYDNAPCHTSFAVQQFLTDKKIPTIPQPSYLPDFILCDFWLFLKLKLGLKSKRFVSIEGI